MKKPLTLLVTLLLALRLSACGTQPSNQSSGLTIGPNTKPAPILRPLASGTQLTSSGLEFAYYPRVVCLAYNGSANGRLIARFDSRVSGTPTTPVFQSTDNGSSWQEIARFSDTSTPRICCSGLYELPQAFGNNPAGTLFWATSVGIENPRGPTAIRIWRSTTQGYNWSYYTTAVTGNTGGQVDRYANRGVAIKSCIRTGTADHGDRFHRSKTFVTAVVRKEELAAPKRAVVA